MEGKHKCTESLERMEGQRVAEASKAIFIEVKFIHTFILCICLEQRYEQTTVLAMIQRNMA